MISWFCSPILSCYSLVRLCALTTTSWWGTLGIAGERLRSGWLSCIISLHWTEKLCRIAVPTNIISIGKMKPHATNNWESLFPNSIDVYSHFALCSWTPCFEPGVTQWLNKGWLSHLRWEKLNPLSKYF